MFVESGDNCDFGWSSEAKIRLFVLLIIENEASWSDIEMIGIDSMMDS